ncbi:hypothetical protein ACQP1K_07880 [Sphaerimonospora sp. CA-214678]|uniref:hypothetical protein n=1 Tax=Sphaerimonospora sp. CA-214678 TaxID=3240029 RepID=UPI003D8AA65B
MTSLAHILDGLHCPGCGTLDALWLDALRGIVECAECGHKARVLVDGPGLADLLDTVESADSLGVLGSLGAVDSLDTLNAVDLVGSCGGGW